MVEDSTPPADGQAPVLPPVTPNKQVTTPAGDRLGAVPGAVANDGSQAASEPPAAKPATDPGESPGYAGSILTSPSDVVPAQLATAVKDLEKALGRDVWLLIQGNDAKYRSLLDDEAVTRFVQEKHRLTENRPIALVIDSPGGHAKCAYQLAMLFRRRCGGFIAVVPRYAKSAATLLSLGADAVLLGEFGELGPLDVQILDPDREQINSALDEVQSLERLLAFSLEAVDQAMLLFVNRTGKKVDNLLPDVMCFVTDMMRPLTEKIDTVHYTMMSRILKVAEEYAVRLLKPRYPPDVAERIARHLVERYPEHGFVIDAEEAASIGLKVMPLNTELVRILDTLAQHLQGITVLGR